MPGCVSLRSDHPNPPPPQFVATPRHPRRGLQQPAQGVTGPVVILRISGRLYRIGIGRTHVILLVEDLHVPVVAATTGQLLRELTIDPPRSRRGARLCGVWLRRRDGFRFIE